MLLTTIEGSVCLPAHHARAPLHAAQLPAAHRWRDDNAFPVALSTFKQTNKLGPVGSCVTRTNNSWSRSVVSRSPVPRSPSGLTSRSTRQKPIYNAAQTLTLRTALDLDRFVATLNRVVAENDALRLRFAESDGEIFQQVMSDVFVNLEFRDLSAERHPETAARDWIEEVVRKPLGATDFPLFKFALVKFATDRFLWLQKYHHLIIDGIGRQLVAARVARIYDALSADAEPPPAANGSYIAVAKAAEDQYLASDSFAADEAYWRTRLNDLPEPLVQADAHLSEKSRSGRLARLEYDLSREGSDALRVFARRQGSTLFKVILCVTWCCFSSSLPESQLGLWRAAGQPQGRGCPMHCGSVRKGDALPPAARSNDDVRRRPLGSRYRSLQ